MFQKPYPSINRCWTYFLICNNKGLRWLSPAPFAIAAGNRSLQFFEKCCSFCYSCCFNGLREGLRELSAQRGRCVRVLNLLWVLAHPRLVVTADVATCTIRCFHKNTRTCNKNRASPISDSILWCLWCTGMVPFQTCRLEYCSRQRAVPRPRRHHWQRWRRHHSKVETVQKKGCWVIGKVSTVAVNLTRDMNNTVKCGKREINYHKMPFYFLIKQQQKSRDKSSPKSQKLLRITALIRHAFNLFWRKTISNGMFNKPASTGFIRG